MTGTRPETVPADPRFVTLTATDVVGLHRTFLHGLSPETTAPQVIGPLWEEFVPRSDDVPHRLPGGPKFGVIWGDPEGERAHPHELHYLACVEVTSLADVPPGMTSRTLPEATYAVITHRGPICRIAESVGWLYRTWLPASDWEHTGVADIELYDERFGGDLDTSEMDYFVSVRPRDAGAPSAP